MDRKELGLSDESKFIKNILIKVSSNLKESVESKNIDKLCEDLNSGEVIITPSDENVVMAYYPTLSKDDGSNGVVITGYSSKEKSGQPNVIIRLSMDEFYKSVVIM